MLRNYFGKMRGSQHGSPPRVSTREIFFSWLASFLGIAAVAWVSREVTLLSGQDITLMIGSFGASAVLVFGAIHSPLAQPRNLIGGHVLSALVGVLCWKYLHAHMWFAEAMAVSAAIALMHVTRTLHPPGGATALIAVIGSANIHQLGFSYILVPVTLGAVTLLLVALLVNNLWKSRRYPEIWF
jgi:CBS-domain-containing membrane protein